MSDTYVNSWDICNKVSDILMIRMNRELCSCGTSSVDFTSSVQLSALSNTIDRDYYDDLVRKYSSIFQRYVFLKDFIEGKMSFTNVED